MRALIAVSLLVVDSLVGGLQAQSAGASAAVDTSALRTLVETEMARLAAPGLSVAIVRDGEVVYAGGFGQARIEDRTAAAAETLYRTASVAKPITATAIMQLVEAGLIDLDVPVQRYCPAYPEKRWAVTVRQLLSHTSGVRHTTDREDALTTYFPEIEDGLGLFRGDRLQHEPGTRSTYSTHGYTILACAVEGASGGPYLDYLVGRVLRPAGMSMTLRDTVDYANPRRALGYRKGGGGVVPSMRVTTSFKLAGGGLVSDVLDLARFAIAVEEHVLLSAGNVEVMWTPTPLADGRATPFGLGWQILEHKGHRVVVVAGQQDEVSTVLLMVPDRRAAVVLMCNLERHAEQLTALVGRILELAGIV